MCPNVPVTENQHARRSKKHSKVLKKDMSSFTQRIFDTFALKSFLYVAASNVRSSWTTELPNPSLGCGDYFKSHLPNLLEVPTKPDGDYLDEYITRTSDQVIDEEHSSEFLVNAVTTYQGPTVTSKTTAFGPVSSGVKSAHNNGRSARNVPSVLPAPLTTTVSHFTWENVSALIDATNEVRGPDYINEHQFLRCIGRPTMATYLIALDISSTNAVERKTAFATQRVIHILSNVDCLLASFRTPPYARAVDYDPSRAAVATTAFTYIWISFFEILKLGGYDSIIPSCLRSSLREVERYHFFFDLGQSPFSPSSARQLSNSLDDSAILHISNIVLAALVASVPVCSPESWISICERRSQGRVSYEPRIFSEDVFPRNSVGIIDSLEDERLLGLTRELIRLAMIYNERRSIASGQHAQHHRHHVRGNPLFGAESCLFDLLMDHRFTKDHCTIAAEAFGNITPESCFAHLYFTILELLRTVFLKEWDGSAVVSRTGLVAGAADCMNVLCKSTPSFHPLVPARIKHQ